MNRRKMLLAGITLALVLGVPGGVWAKDVDLSNAVFTVHDPSVMAAHTTNGTETEKGKTINVSMTNTGGGAIGLRVERDSQLTVGNSDSTKSVNIYANGAPASNGDGGAYGAWVTGDSDSPSGLHIHGANIGVTAESGGNATGLLAGSSNAGGFIGLEGGPKNQSVTIRASTTGQAGYDVYADGVRVVSQGQAIVDGTVVSISAEAAGTNNTARGIAANRSDYDYTTGSSGGGGGVWQLEARKA